MVLDGETASERFGCGVAVTVLWGKESTRLQKPLFDRCRDLIQLALPLEGRNALDMTRDGLA